MLIIWFFAGLFVDLVCAQRGLLTTNNHPSILQGLFAIEPIETVRGKEIVPKANRELQQNVPTFTTHATFPRGRAPQTKTTRQQSSRGQVQLREHPLSTRPQEVHSRKPTPESVMQVQGHLTSLRNSNSHRGHRKMKHHHRKSFEINSDTEEMDLPTSNVKRPVSIPRMREKTRTLTTEARQGLPTEQEVRQRPKPTFVESASDAQSTLPLPSVTRRKFTRLLRKPKPPVTSTQTLHREHKHGAPTIPPPVFTTQTLRRQLMTSTSIPQSTRKHSAPLSRVPATRPPSTTVQMRATTSIPITRRVRPHLRLVTLPPGRSLKQFQGAEDSRQQSSEASSEKIQKSSHSRVPNGEQRDPLPQKKKLASEASILEQDLIKASMAIEAQVIDTRTESKHDAEVNRNGWALVHHPMKHKTTRKPKILRLTHNPSRSQSSKAQNSRSDEDPERHPQTVLNTDSEPGTVRVVNRMKTTTSAPAQAPRTEPDAPPQKIVPTMHPSDTTTSSEPRTSPTSTRDQHRPTTTLSTHTTQKQSLPSSRKIEQMRSRTTLLPVTTTGTSVAAISRIRPTTPSLVLGNHKSSQTANTRSQPAGTYFNLRSEAARPQTTTASLPSDRALGESTISNSKRRPVESNPASSEDRKSESRHTAERVHPTKHKITDDSLNFVDIPELQQDLTIYRNLPISNNVFGRQNVLKPQVVIPDRQAAEQSFGKFAIRMPVMPSIHSMTNELPFGAESSFRQRS